MSMLALDKWARLFKIISQNGGIINSMLKLWHIDTLKVCNTPDQFCRYIYVYAAIYIKNEDFASARNYRGYIFIVFFVTFFFIFNYRRARIPLNKVDSLTACTYILIFNPHELVRVTD